MSLCECGCGRPAPIAPRTNRSKGWIEGRPLRFIRGHAGHDPESNQKQAATLRARGSVRLDRNPNWKGDQVGYAGVHHWLASHARKSGVCDECGKTGPTHWANVDGRYRRRREDYRELCQPCHFAFDMGRDAWGAAPLSRSRRSSRSLGQTT